MPQKESVRSKVERIVSPEKLTTQETKDVLGSGGVPFQRDFMAAHDAHDQAVAAGGFRKHGANGNMVHPKSSAIAPHDKGR